MRGGKKPPLREIYNIIIWQKKTPALAGECVWKIIRFIGLGRPFDEHQGDARRVFGL